jgi:alkaline phosphatase
MLDRRGDMLPSSTQAAINILNSSGKGFFLMVEGSQIDWGAHSNNAELVAQEVIDFDNAIGIALQYAKDHGNTLVIVTADHETGGMSIINGDFETGAITARFGTTNHTGVMVPVFAFGPGAELFQGIQENTDIFHKMMLLLDLDQPKNPKKNISN